MTTRVLIIDDHHVVRAGLTALLEEGQGMRVIAQAGDGTAGLQALDAHAADVVLLDISMPGKSGMDVFREIRQRYPGVAVLILTIHPEGEHAVRYLRGGALGYLTKECAAEELVDAVRSAAAGRRYITQALAVSLAEAVVDDAGPPHAQLSDREYEVLCRIGQGMTVSQIAEALSLSVKTVSTYRTRILQKLQLETTAQLTLDALQNELVVL